MNHEIMIPFNFDTSFIEKKLQDDGYSEVMNQLTERAQEQMMKQLPTSGGCYDRWNMKQIERKIDWYKFFSDRMNKWFEVWISEHGQEIIDEAALLMAKRGASRKAWREVLAEYQEEQNQG